MTTQTMDVLLSKINVAPFKEWMNVILTVTRTITLLQGSSGRNYSGEISRLTLKN